MQYPLHPCARRTRTPPVATLFAPRRHRLVLGSLAPGTYPRRPARTGAGTNPAAAARPQASVRMQRTGAAVPQPAVKDPVAPRIIPNRSEPAARQPFQTLTKPPKTPTPPSGVILRPDHRARMTPPETSAAYLNPYPFALRRRGIKPYLAVRLTSGSSDAEATTASSPPASTLRPPRLKPFPGPESRWMRVRAETPPPAVGYGRRLAPKLWSPDG